MSTTEVAVVSTNTDCRNVGTEGVCMRTAEQLWPPFAVDLHIPAAWRKDNSTSACNIGSAADMKIFSIFVLIACVAWQVSAQEEGEARPAQRGLLKRGLLPKGKQTTTTTTAAPQEYAEYEDEGDYPAEAEAGEPSTEAAPSSTEGKKLVAGGVRPFRSNNDLLEILKKKRAQAAEAKSRGATVSESAASSDSGSEAKSNYSGKKKNNVATASEDAPAPVSKPSRGRFNRPSSKAAEPEAEEQNESAPPSRSNRFSRRGNY